MEIGSLQVGVEVLSEYTVSLAKQLKKIEKMVPGTGARAWMVQCTMYYQATMSMLNLSQIHLWNQEGKGPIKCF